MKDERWAPIVGYGGMYAVSTLGRVWSMHKGGSYLRPGIASNGYPTVALGRGNTRTVHSLVAEAFIGPTPAGQEVRHRDGDRLNPVLENLEHGTRTENIHDAIKHGSWMSAARRAGMQRMGEKMRLGMLPVPRRPKHA